MFHVILTFTQFSFFPLLQLFRTRWCKCSWTTKYNTVDDSPESTKHVSSSLNLANQSYNSLWPTVLTQHYIVTFLQIFTCSQTLNTRIGKKKKLSVKLFFGALFPFISMQRLPLRILPLDQERVRTNYMQMGEFFVLFISLMLFTAFSHNFSVNECASKRLLSE